MVERRENGNSGSGQPIVTAQRLTKVFKDFWMRDRARAVDSIDFEIYRGEVFGLLGPNGSGKSTTIKLMLGLLKKTSGRLNVFGKLPTDVSIKKRIGYLPEESYLYPFLNARETLEYYAKLFRLDRRVRGSRIDELLEMVGLTAVQHRQVREYSKGMQRRIGIAQALINDPEFLILDEPTTGLDPIGTRQVKDLIIHLGERGKTILLSSHLLSDVEDCVDRMVILYGGKIRAEGTCDDLLTAHSRVSIEAEDLDTETIQEIEQVLHRRHHDDAVISRPRQKLEELFIDIVERARAERVATSGAMDGGGTAAFLMGQDAPSEGAAVIDELLSAPDPVSPDEPAAAEPQQPVSTKGPDESLIDDLLSSARADGEDAASPPQGASPQNTKTPRPDKSGDAGTASSSSDVDESIISSLLGDAESDTKQDKKS